MKRIYRLSFITILLLALTAICNAATYEYSLKNSLEEWQHYPINDNERMLLYNKLLQAKKLLSETGSKKLYNQLIQFADSVPDKNFSTLIYARVATDLADVSDSSCFSIVEKGIEIAQKKNADYGMIQLLHVKVYLKWLIQENYKKRLEYIHNLQNEASEKDIPFGIALAIKEKAFLYYSVNQYDSSHYYAEFSLNNYANLLNSNTIIGLYNLLGLIENKKKQYSRAIPYFNKTIAYAKSVNDTAWIGIASGNKGMSFYYLSEYDSAFNNLKIDVHYSLLGKEYGSAAMAMATLGDMYNNIYQQPDSADYYLMFAIETVWNGRMENIISVYQTVYEYYEKSKKYDKAYRYIKEYQSVADSLKPLLAEQRLEKFQKQYELEKKNKEVELLEVENELQKKQTQRNRIIVSSLVIFICMLTIILIIVYEMKERNKRTSNKIKEQSEAISKQAKELKVLNDIKDKIFSILSHDMRSPIASVKNTFDLLDARLINEKEFNTLKEKISNQLFNLNIVLDNLLQWSKSQIQGRAYNTLMPVSYYELIERNLKLFDSQIKNKGLSVINNLDKNLVVLADFNKVDIVVRNLLSNAIKFTFAGGSIEVYSKNENGVSTLCIKDSGNGIREEDQSKLFEIKGANRQYGTAGESGTGLGLWLCKTYVEQNEGEISFTSESGKGSTFCISLPEAKTEKQS